MAECIEREKAFDAVFGQFCACSDETEAALNAAIEEIRAIPAAAVRPVVFCRDCIHYKPQQKSKRWSNTTPMCSRSATIKMPPDGFCSFGVKREES